VLISADGSALARSRSFLGRVSQSIASAFAVHAKDDTACAFYEHFGFVASSSDPFHLFVLMKDLRRIAGV
jgi:hypothetical protein